MMGGDDSYADADSAGKAEDDSQCSGKVDVVKTCPTRVSIWFDAVGAQPIFDRPGGPVLLSPGR